MEVTRNSEWFEGNHTQSGVVSVLWRFSLCLPPFYLSDTKEVRF